MVETVSKIKFINRDEYRNARGLWHRIDGPAIEWHYGETAWFLNGHPYSFDKWLEKNDQISDEDKTLLKLQYG